LIAIIKNRLYRFFALLLAIVALITTYFLWPW
jgi:hypothetical protein